MHTNETALAEVRRLNEDLNDAALSGDADFLRAHLSDGFVASDPTNTIRRRDDLIALFSRAQVSYDSYEAQVDFAEEVAPDLIVIMGTEATTQSVTPEGAPSDLVQRKISRRFTNIFQKKPDSWKLIVKQSTITKVE